MATTELSFTSPSLPSQCPVCGAYSLAPEASVSVLLAVCDVLAFKALEKMGKFILRAGRYRYNEIGSRPPHIAHTIWPVSDEIVSKALRGAWDVVPLLLDTHGGCCEFETESVVRALDEYVHDLVITGTAHDIDELAYRLQTQLGLPVYRNPDAHGVETEDGFHGQREDREA